MAAVTRHGMQSSEVPIHVRLVEQIGRPTQLVSGWLGEVQSAEQGFSSLTSELDMIARPEQRGPVIIRVGSGRASRPVTRGAHRRNSIGWP